VSFRGRPKAESRNPFDSAFGLAQDKPAGWAVARSRHGPQVPPLGRNAPSVGMTCGACRTRSLGRDDTVGVASLPSVGMTFRCVIPREAKGRFEESIRLGLRPRSGQACKVGRDALTPMPADPSTRAQWALGRDDTVGVASLP